jgi:DNA-binding response OmpR family regulator
MYRILLVGDARSALAALTAALAQQGHAVRQVRAKEDLAAAVGRLRPQAALVDALSLGAAFERRCQDLRRLTAPTEVPLIAVVDPDWLSAGSLPAGVADFLCEPVSASEAEARLRRALFPDAPALSDDVVRVGPLAIDQGRHEVFLAGRPLDLTLREYDLLTFLAGRPGRVFSREALLDRVWGLDYLGGARTVDVHVRRLRVKLDDEVGQLLQTVRGVGYRLVDE